MRCAILAIALFELLLTRRANILCLKLVLVLLEALYTPLIIADEPGVSWYNSAFFDNNLFFCQR
jgi:hypothetical protein